jgi:hypothetical protein
VCGHDLDVLVPRATVAVAVLVLDAGIRETDVAIVVRQVVLTRPSRDLFRLAVRTTVAVLLSAIALVEESLIVALELVVQRDPPNPTALAAKALLGPLVGAIDLRIVGQLAGLPDGVEGLAGLVAAVIALVAVGFEEIAPALGQDDGAIVGTEWARPNQSLALKMSSAPTRIVGIVAKVTHIPLGDDPKCADGSQHAALSAVDLVNALALSNQFALGTAREVEIYTRVLNRGGHGVRGPLDQVACPTRSLCQIGRERHQSLPVYRDRPILTFMSR